jgi:hypothetical protein
MLLSHFILLLPNQRFNLRVVIQLFQHYRQLMKCANTQKVDDRFAAFCIEFYWAFDEEDAPLAQPVRAPHS